MPPPPRKGGMASRMSSRVQKIPMPVGPSILCPVKIRKSMSRATTSVGKCATDCAPSTAISAPVAMGESGEFVDRVDRAQDVGHARDGEQFDTAHQLVDS
jgi:hypothetical protein